jgi:single-strand DNA-binding protein
MSGVNKVIIIGRLGQDPEMRQTAGGQQVCTLSVATSDYRIVDGQKQEKTEWHRIVLWDKQAELASKYLKKGKLAYFEGKLQTRSWQDNQGQKKYTTEIIANSMQFIDSARDSTSDQHQQEPERYEPRTNGYTPQTQDTGFGGSDEDIPF